MTKLEPEQGVTFWVLEPKASELQMLKPKDARVKKRRADLNYLQTGM
jgi:hypothetical protein